MSLSNYDVNRRYGVNWSKEEAILAFELYCRIPFKLTKANNPEVVKLAALLGRTPASVARKLGNFGAFDPELHKKSISGLTHTSKLDKEVWEEFNEDWNTLVWESNLIRTKLDQVSELESDFVFPVGPSEKNKLMKQRVHQSFFRDAILSSFSSKCCITGLNIKECLIASHIVPWNVEEKFRTNPQNGLCLSATFDKLYDSGLMTVTPEFVIVFSSKITEDSSDCFAREQVLRYNQCLISLPYRFLPAKQFLAWHQDNRFIS